LKSSIEEEQGSEVHESLAVCLTIRQINYAWGGNEYHPEKGGV
jgi:hypothetical protein